MGKVYTRIGLVIVLILTSGHYPLLVWASNKYPFFLSPSLLLPSFLLLCFPFISLSTSLFLSLILSLQVWLSRMSAFFKMRLFKEASEELATFGLRREKEGRK